MYNPVIGRFTQEDIYRGDGLNLYAYCKSNPVRYYDSTGYSSANKENSFALENELPEGGACGENSGNMLNGNAKNKTKMTLEKVDKAIRELSLGEQKINFNSVSNLSGVSKTFLYNNSEIKQRIEELRDKQTEKIIKQRLKYDKTDKSKDIIIMAKDKKIKELREENRKLKEQL